MAYKISDECVSCGACVDACPVGAIAEGNGKYEINPELCVECGACEGACPVATLQSQAFATAFIPTEENPFSA